MPCLPDLNSQTISPEPATRSDLDQTRIAITKVIAGRICRGDPQRTCKMGKVIENAGIKAE